MGFDGKSFQFELEVVFRKISARHTVLQNCQDHEPEKDLQLLACSWCGTEIMPKRFSEDLEDYDIRCNPDNKFEFFCPSDNCDFHSRLPIQVVDQALYANPPTLLIGTIDKFARLTWKAEASAFFGNGKKSPPSLVNQDELHLISGPLGTGLTHQLSTDVPYCFH